MADAWAQMTGELGVAMLTAGPGLTNGLAPLYSALQAESPVLLISGDSSVAEDGGRVPGAGPGRNHCAMTKLSLRPMSVGNCIPRWTARSGWRWRPGAARCIWRCRSIC